MTESSSGKWNIAYTYYNSLAGIGESLHAEGKLDLDATTEQAAFDEGKQKWSELLALGTSTISEPSWDSQGMHRIDVVYPHSPRLVYERDVMAEFDDPLKAPRFIPSPLDGFEKQLENTTTRLKELQNRHQGV